MFEFIKKFVQCLFVWHVPGGDMTDADVIIVHAAGVNHPDGSPAPINCYLADLVSRFHDRNRLPLIPQGEMKVALEGKVAASFIYGNIPTQRESQLGYLDTIDVLQIQKRVCIEHGWRYPVLVTTRPHMLRALLAARRIGLEAIPFEIPEAVWDPANEQIWMRNPWLNLPRELLVRLVWLFQGKL